MKSEPSFSDILTASANGWSQRDSDEFLLSLAVPIQRVNPLAQLPLLSKGEQFRFLWDEAPGLCIAASGECQHLDLAGPRRFELAQRFSENIFGRIQDAIPIAPSQANPRILLSFSFFDQISERKRSFPASSPLQAILPRWQLTTHGFNGWLRLNGVPSNESEVRELVEELWIMRDQLSSSNENEFSISQSSIPGICQSNKWKNCYEKALIQGIDLVNNGVLDKLVLAVRQSILLNAPLDPLLMLGRLRKQQSSSCRFLWQRSEEQAFFGASPERLLVVRNGYLQSDALAGTAMLNDDGQELLKSEKDLREHELVVKSITQQLLNKGLSPHRSRSPRLAKHGQLLHLHTPITAAIQNQQPLSLAKALHPTPAVAGLPRQEAMQWINNLEPFDRGSYAAPLGWIDNCGNAEFRVAIRCGSAVGNRLELTAGAGLVRGSIAEREMQEVGLKLAVLADQLDLIEPNIQLRQFNNRAII